MTPSESEIDLAERRSAPDALKLYIMSHGNRHFVCAGNDPVKAAKNIQEQFGVDYENCSVHQGVVVNEKFVRELTDDFGITQMKRADNGN